MARQRATTSEEIVAAAARVFEVKGYRNTTIDDISEAAGISRPTVYKYIESKPWLLDRMVDAVTQELTAKLDELFSSPLPPKEKLRRGVELHIELATQKRVYYAIVLSELTELSDAGRRTWRAWSRDVTDRFTGLIDDYLRSEGIPPRMSTTVLANLMLTMLTSLHRWYDPAGPTTPDQLAQQVLTLLSGALPDLDQPAL